MPVDLRDDLPYAAPVTPRTLTLALAAVATSLGVAIASVVPLPYAISSPGPTLDTLGELEGEALITVADAESYESTGKLLLTTVAVAGGPSYPVQLDDVVRGWLDGSRAVSPEEDLFSPSQTREDIDERNTAAMISSQENATVAALAELGYEVPTVLEVAQTLEGSNAVDVLESGDVIVAVDGVEVPSFAALSAEMDAVEPGAEVVVGVLRAGERADVPVTTVDGGDGRALLGVGVDPEFELPVDVTIAIEDIGGPSAGTMFALGIIDTLTEADETGGVTIAGTGTIDLTGTVGPIGGIRQKLAGALRDGATWFLAPEANCAEVVGYVPRGLRVASVGTLAEARAAMEAIGAGRGDTLETC